jgi:hypothetical protein
VKLRWKIILALVIAGIITTLLLIHSQAGSRHAVEAYKKQLRDRGEKLSSAELAPAPSTNVANGAIAFMAATNLFHPPSNYPSMMRMTLPGRASIAWRQNPLPMDGVSNIWPTMLAELQPHKQEMQQLRDMVHKPEFYFNLDYSREGGVLLPHLSRLKGATIFAAAATMAALHEGNDNEAWENLRTTVTLVRVYQGEPLIISHLVRSAMASLAIQASWEALQCDRWTDQQLLQLQLDCEAMDLFSPESSLKMERASIVEELRRARKSSDLYSMYVGSATGNASTGPNFSELIGGVFRNPRTTINELYKRYPYFWAWKWLWSYDEELFSLKVMDAVLDSAHQAKATGAYIPAMKAFDSATTNLHKVFPDADKHFQIFVQQDQLMRKYLVKLADIEVGRRLLVTAIALQRYHLAHGNYPENLNELVPDFLTMVPIDLMDGKPLRYQKKSDGTFLLYSVGEDGEDNGGDPVNGAKFWLKARDAVWPMPIASMLLQGRDSNAVPAITKGKK